MSKIFVVVIGVTILLGSCQNPPKAVTADTTEAKTVYNAATGTNFKADIAQTKIEFIGTKPTGKHHGIIGIKEGSLTVAGTDINVGRFVIDLNTLRTDDQDSSGNARLGGHLRSPDFFDVPQFDTAIFEITSVVKLVDKQILLQDATHTVTGNLILKGISKNISFPAHINMQEAIITADANFNIDRKQWGLGEAATLKDKLISPIVNINVHLVANK
jgi:polyisoprenoid-binding protein YceI